jgi:O-antigen/teichoic acid export membrane protein
MGVAHNALLIKKIKAKQRGIIDMVSVLFSGITGLVLALNGYAYWGLAIQQLSQTIIATALRWYFAKWRPTFHFDFSPIKEMFGYSIKLFITSIFAQITNNLFSVILGRLYGKSETGYYAQGNKWAAYGSFVIVGTLGVAHPVLIEAKSDIKRQRNAFRKMLRFGAFITFPALLGLAFIGKEFIFITIGEKWLNSVIYMQLFCLWGINSYLHSLYTVLICSHEKSDIYMKIMIVLFVSQLTALFFCSSYGILSMICVYICLYFLSTLAFQFYANRITGLRIKEVVKDLFPYVSAAITAIIIAWLISLRLENVYLKLTVKILITSIVYCAVLWFGNSVILKESLGYLKGKAL